MRILCAIAALAAFVAMDPRPAAQPRTAEEVAAALQAKYENTIRDFSADFTHTYEGGVLRRRLVERGTVLIKKPGRMRWEDERPERKLFVSDGSQIFQYFPDDNQVTISPVPSDDRAPTAALFLTGKGNLVRDFRASFIEGAAPDTYALRLEPKQEQPEYDWLELVVDRDTLQIRTLAAADAQGGRSTFQFSDFKENIGLTDKRFEFRIPRGAEVIHAGPVKG